MIDGVSPCCRRPHTESAIAGALLDEAKVIGRHPGFADVLIAASARALDAMILTANLRHFEPLTPRCADPFQPGFL